MDIATFALMLIAIATLGVMFYSINKLSES